MRPSTAPPSGQAIAPALLGVVLGAALQLQQARLSPLACYVAATGVAVLLLAGCLRGPARWWRLLAVLACAALLSAGLAGWRASVHAQGVLSPDLEGRDIQVTGVVASLPHRNEAGLRFRFEIESAHLDGGEVALPAQVLLGWYGQADAGDEGDASPRQPADLRPGERWQWTVRLKAPHGHVNPHGFDYELWLWEQGLQATGYVRTGARDPPPRRLAPTWRHPIEQARHRVRDAIHARVPDPALAGVLAALVVGDQGAIDRDDWEVFRATGVAHLMSISGLHVTMFAWAAAALVGTAWRRSARLCLAWPAQHAGLVGGLLLAAAYALFSGWGVPAQRTVLMLAVAAWLRLRAREWPWPWVWLLACAVVVLADPWALAQAGFWLSFVAVGVLFASGPPVAAEDASPRPRWRRLLQAGRGMAREQGIVTLALTPLTLLLFQQVSLVGLVANLLAIPWVTLVVTPLGLLGVVAPPLWTAAACAVDGLVGVLRVLAELPFATWSAPAPPGWAAAAGVAGGLLLCLPAPWSARLLGVPLLVPVLLWQTPRPPPGEFELLAADVGQGNAVLVRTATHTLLYDAGPGYSRETDAGQRVLVPLLRAGGDVVGLLLLSHRDSDHTGGAAAVLRAHPAAGLVSSLEDGHPLLAGRSPVRCTAGQRWEWDGVRFEVLHPAAGAAAGRAKPNTLSCVLRVGNGRVHALLAGDIEKAQEAALVAEPASLRSDVLLVPHHGSKTSSSEAFLDAVRPSAALVQAGYHNRFGHPAPEVLERYAARHIAVYASAQCGAAMWDSRSPHQVRCARQVLARYWHHLAARDYKSGA